MTDDCRHIPLRIERMSDGGFMVNERDTGPLFASTSIGEALEFIARRLDPEALEALKRAQEEAALKAAQAKAAHEEEADEMAVDPGPARCSRCGSAGAERYCPRGCS